MIKWQVHLKNSKLPGHALFGMHSILNFKFVQAILFSFIWVAESACLSSALECVCAHILKQHRKINSNMIHISELKLSQSMIYTVIFWVFEIFIRIVLITNLYRCREDFFSHFASLYWSLTGIIYPSPSIVPVCHKVMESCGLEGTSSQHHAQSRSD